MNDRILTLAGQAKIHFSRIGILDGDPNGTARMVGYSKMEEFAELVIKECVAIAYEHNNSGEGGVVAEQINQHFGVEE
jgi:hypothetical protein